MRVRELPSSLTSYDFLKALALLLMLVDHFGAYVMADEMWLRAVGRLSAPIWLFLIGFARSRDLDMRLWIGMGVLILVDMLIGYTILPINILGSFLLIRMIIDKVMPFYQHNAGAKCLVWLCVIFLALPSKVVFEYGVHGFMFAGLGYLVRAQHEKVQAAALAGRKLIRFDNGLILNALGVAVVFAVMQIFSFSFGDEQKIFVLASLPILAVCLIGFRPATYEGVSQKMSALLVWLIQLCGRRTLEIYVIHIAVLRIYAAAVSRGDVEWFHLRLTTDAIWEDIVKFL